MTIYKIDLYRDENANGIEARADVATGKIDYWAQFRDIVYNAERNLTANVVSKLTATTLEGAFAEYGPARDLKASQMTMDFIKFLDDNPEQAAKFRARKNAVEAGGPKILADRATFTGDRLVTAETAKRGSLFTK